MFGLEKIAKMVKGGMDLDQLAEVLSIAIGGDCEVTQIQTTDPEIVKSRLGKFVHGSSSILVSCTTRDGRSLRAILILGTLQVPEKIVLDNG